MNKNFPDKMPAVDAIKLINDSKDKFSDVEGASLRPELLEQFNNNFKDLGTAISSATGTYTYTWDMTKYYNDVTPIGSLATNKASFSVSYNIKLKIPSNIFTHACPYS